jgi:hypothetical protein
MTRASSTLTIDGQEMKLSTDQLVDVKAQLENIVRGKGFGLLVVTSPTGERTMYVNQSSHLSMWEPS